MRSLFLKKELDRGKVSEEVLSRHTGHRANTIGKQYREQSSEYGKDQQEWTKIYKNITHKWRLNTGFIKSLQVWFKTVANGFKKLITWAEAMPKNIKLCLDEIYLKGNVYTILSRPGMKKLLGIQYGTKSEKIIKKLKGLPAVFIKNVTEIAIDMSPTMEKIVRWVFVHAMIVIDRFHVRFNINEYIKDTKNRIKRAINKKKPKKSKKRGRPKKGSKSKWRPLKRYGNGETKLELITRVHYQILKNEESRSLPEKRRWKIIKTLADMKWLVTTYEMTQEVYHMYEDQSMTKNRAMDFLNKRIARVRKRKRLVELQAIASMIERRVELIANYFVSRHSNGYGEWQNQRMRRLVFDNKWFINNDYMIFRFIKAFW